MSDLSTEQYGHYEVSQHTRIREVTGNKATLTKIDSISSVLIERFSKMLRHTFNWLGRRGPPLKECSCHCYADSHSQLRVSSKYHLSMHACHLQVMTSPCTLASTWPNKYVHVHVYSNFNNHHSPYIRCTILVTHSSLAPCIFSHHKNVPSLVCVVKQYLDRWDLIRNIHCNDTLVYR